MALTNATKPNIEKESKAESEEEEKETNGVFYFGTRCTLRIHEPTVAAELRHSFLSSQHLISSCPIQLVLRLGTI